MNPYTNKDQLLRDLSYEQGFLNGFKSGSSLAAQCESEGQHHGLDEHSYKKGQKTTALIAQKMNNITEHHANEIIELRRLARDFPETPKDMGGE